jgi:LacI family transcriptional regulator
VSAVTIADVARLAEVSLGTVSRVLNNNPTVRPATRKAVLAAIAELGYRPNINARNLRSQRTRAIGMLFTDMTQAMVSLGIRGAGMALHPHGYALLVGDSRGDPEFELESFASLVDRRVDGVLWFPVGARASVEPLILSSGVPVVLFGQTSPSTRIPTAMVDEHPAFDAMAADLAALGHRAFGFVGHGPTVRGRLRRLETALGRSGLSRDPRFEVVVSNKADCYQAVRALLERSPRPTALLATPADLVPPTVRAIHDAGLEMGQDLSLIGFGETEWAQALVPTLSVISVDYTTHVRDAATVLLQHIEGIERAPRVVRHQSVYVRRGSVGPAPRT